MRPAANMAISLDRGEAIPPEALGAPAAGPVHVHVHKELGEDLAQDWNALADEASEPNGFCEPWFIAASLATVGVGRGVRLVEVRRGSRLIGIIPLAIEDHYGRSPIRIVQNWWHHQMFLGTPMVRAGEEETFWSALLDHLDAAGWAPNFLHLRGLVEDGPIHRGLAAAAAKRGRACPVVRREVRALLESEVGSRAYYEQTIRAKKRKEIRRLRSRLEEQGPVRFRRYDPSEDLGAWCDSFLALERSGWKGRAGTALACDPVMEAFFRQTVAGAQAADRLDFLRLDLGDRPIAMLVNFRAAPGGFSFKTCFDEDFARFSPGVLIQLENLAFLDRPDTRWMDSCAAENHPMIDSLWTGRRSIVRVTVRLAGVRRALVYVACRWLETGSQTVRRLLARSSA